MRSNTLRKRGSWKLTAGHDARSPVEPITRSNDSPTVRVSPCAWRMVAMCHGSRISADQPASSSVTAWRQSPSQSSLNWFSLVTVVSMIPPPNVSVKL